VTSTINIAMLGSKFMGRAHSNAWLNVAKFFDVDPRPTMHTVVVATLPSWLSSPNAGGGSTTRPTGDAAVTSEDIGLVDIGTPNNVHAEQAIAALEAGQARRLREAARRNTERLRGRWSRPRSRAPGTTSVWFNYRRVPAIALAHRLVAAGKIGRIYHVRATYLQSWGGPDHAAAVALPGRHRRLRCPRRPQCPHHRLRQVSSRGRRSSRSKGAIEHTFIEERAVLEGDTGGEIAGAGASTTGTKARARRRRVLFLARLSGGGVASFEATRLATGYHNANRFEIHGDRGACGSTSND
jgi:predicted dehydrogenase